MAAILLASSLEGGCTFRNDLNSRAPTDSAGADRGRTEPEDSWLLAQDVAASALAAAKAATLRADSSVEWNSSKTLSSGMGQAFIAPPAKDEMFVDDLGFAGGYDCLPEDGIMVFG